jgi:ribonucleotide reductase beta subunit family protein with ferritin-like domain
MNGVQKKSQWAIEYMESKTKTLPERVVAFVIVEGILFQCAFVVIFWFKKMYPGKLFGITFSNDLISRDEGLHADHGVEVYKLLTTRRVTRQTPSQRLTDTQINAIFQSAMEVERDFINEFMDLDDVLGMNKANMIRYLEYQCDWWLTSLGHTKLYGTANPFPWMDMMALQGRTNFFERRNGEYRRGKSVAATIQSNSFTDASFNF